MPQPLVPMREAIREALRESGRAQVETVWSDAGPIAGDPDWAGGTVFVDRRTQEVGAPAPHAFDAIARLGGRTSWSRSESSSCDCPRPVTRRGSSIRRTGWPT
jgi:hypothetical protein